MKVKSMNKWQRAAFERERKNAVDAEIVETLLDKIKKLF